MQTSTVEMIAYTRQLYNTILTRLHLCLFETRNTNKYMTKHKEKASVIVINKHTHIKLIRTLTLNET